MLNGNYGTGQSWNKNKNSNMFVLMLNYKHLFVLTQRLMHDKQFQKFDDLHDDFSDSQRVHNRVARNE